MKKENEKNFEVIETIENEDIVTDEVNDEFEFVLVEDGNGSEEEESYIGHVVAAVGVVVLGFVTSFVIMHKEELKAEFYATAVKRSEKKIQKEIAKKQKLEEKEKSMKQKEQKLIDSWKEVVNS